jgi:sorting nexin-25
LHPWLASQEKEQEFLREATEVFLLYLLPDTYAKSDEIRHLFREIMAVNGELAVNHFFLALLPILSIYKCVFNIFSVFHPAMNLVCDPDYINQKIVECLNYKEFLASEQAKTFTYAASYEEFMKMIEVSQDVEYLKLLRLAIPFLLNFLQTTFVPSYNIISEIMQATTIQNLKRAKGMDTGGCYCQWM